MDKITRPILYFFLCAFLLTSCSKDNIKEEVESFDQLATKKTDYNYSLMELEILERINIYRTVKGLNELKPIVEISLEAEVHNSYMIDNGEVSHDNFAERASYLANEVDAKSVSENIAYGYRTADAVVNAWLKSKDHRKNIEKNLTHFGISVRQDAEGKNYFTNIFIRK